MSKLIREWISCSSPLLLVAKDHLGAWEGSAVPAEGRNVEARFRWNPNGPATDYDRACDVDDFVGLIDVGLGKALVLGDEPLMTTWLPLKDGGVLVRWVCADDEEVLVAAALHISNEDYQDSGLSFTVGDSPLVLFAACESGEDKIYPRIEFEIPAGRYRILTSQYDADARTSLICHRLKLDPKWP